MSSQRNRAPRSERTGPRGGSNDDTAAQTIWDDIRAKLKPIVATEARAKEVNQEIFDTEDRYRESFGTYKEQKESDSGGRRFIKSLISGLNS